MFGIALGLAVLASLAAMRTQHLLASGADSVTALNGGYHFAFLTGALFAAIAAEPHRVINPTANVASALCIKCLPGSKNP